jgi:hypothetical protein
VLICSNEVLIEGLIGIWYYEIVGQMELCEVPNQIPIDVFVVLSQNLWCELLCITIPSIKLKPLFNKLSQLNRVDESGILVFEDV